MRICINTSVLVGAAVLVMVACGGENPDTSEAVGVTSAAIDGDLFCMGGYSGGGYTSIAQPSYWTDPSEDPFSLDFWVAPQTSWPSDPVGTQYYWSTWIYDVDHYPQQTGLVGNCDHSFRVWSVHLGGKSHKGFACGVNAPTNRTDCERTYIEGFFAAYDDVTDKWHDKTNHSADHAVATWNSWLGKCILPCVYSYDVDGGDNYLTMVSATRAYRKSGGSFDTWEQARAGVIKIED